jgi:hypothetical protein
LHISFFDLASSHDVRSELPALKYHVLTTPSGTRHQS